MLTKRAFLQGAGSLATLPAFNGMAAASPAGTLRFGQVAVPLAATGPTTSVIRVEGVDPQGGMLLTRQHATELLIDNGLTDPLVPMWSGVNTPDLPTQPWPSLGPDAKATLRLSPRDSGTTVLRAAPSVAHLAERGAQVVLVVPEAAPPVVDRDIVVRLSDWLLTGDNRLVFGSVPPSEAAASVITVNGDPQPYEVKAPPLARLRLRFVNTSTQRLMVVACAGGRPMIIAIDGQPADLFAPIRNTIPIGPGARYDLLLDMPETAGAAVRFSLRPTLTIGGKAEPDRDLLILRGDGTALPAKPPFGPLPANPNLPAEIPLEKARRAELTFDGTPGTPTSSPLDWRVNGVAGSSTGTPIISARQGDVVVLGLINASATLVPLRIGGHAVRLLHAKDDGWEPYWRDTLLLPPKSRNHVALVAGAPGRCIIDSGFDDLTLAGLSCFFTVTPR